jgi:hypothetical protein
MTTIVYENLNDFLEKLNTLEKTTTIYMTVIHAKAGDSHVASIRIQYADENLLFHMFNYTDGMEPVKILNSQVLELIPDDGSRKQLVKNYEEDINDFEESVKTEYEKAKAVFIQLGYTKIVSAYAV